VTDTPIPPLVLFEGSSYQLMFASMQALLDYVEAIDVRNDEYIVFDGHARRVQVAADSDDGPVTAAVLVTNGDSDELRNRLADLVRAEGPVRFGLIDADLGLDHLLRAVWRRDHPHRPYPAG
jgi:hypothetical protein